MAQKRMFAMTIVDSDAFLDMPLSAQALYFHLNMRADDDGFVGNPKKVMRTVGAAEDDLKLLIAKRFLITFESGVIVIKHWRIHNTLSAGRYHETSYVSEKDMLKLKRNNAYTLNDGEEINDEKLIEMSKRQVDEQKTSKRRTLDEQKTNSDLGLDKELDLDKDLEEEKIINSSCGEPSKSATPPEPVFIKIPLNDKTEYEVTVSKVAEYKETYPAVDVEQQLRNMRQWSIDNPIKRKTRVGISRFMNNWLQREQDRGGCYKNTTTAPRINKAAEQFDEYQSMASEWLAQREGKDE